MSAAEHPLHNPPPDSGTSISNGTTSGAGVHLNASLQNSDDLSRSKTPPHPNPSIVDRLLAKRNLEFPEGSHAPYRSSPLADRNVSPLDSAVLRTASPSTGPRPSRPSFSHKRSETLPSLSALTGNSTATAVLNPGTSPSPAPAGPPPGLSGIPVPSAKPRFRPAHGKSASLSGSGIAQLFGGQGATAVAAAESRPSHLRHVRNRSGGGSFGSTTEATKLLGGNWRANSGEAIGENSNAVTAVLIEKSESPDKGPRITRNRSLSMLSSGSPPNSAASGAVGTPAPGNSQVKNFIKTHSRPRAISLGNPTDFDPDNMDSGQISPTGSNFGFIEPDEHDQLHSDHQTPTRSLWIGNLPPHVTSADLMQIFASYGQIESLRVLPERECAFVNFNTVEEALKARDDVRGARIAGSAVRVGFGKADIFGAETQNMQPTRALWVGNISAHTTPQLLHSVFIPFGAIESARVLTHKNCGFVNFEKEEDAIRAKTVMNGQEIAGAIVRIGFAKVPSKAESSGTGTVQGTSTPPLLIQHQATPNFSFPAVRPSSAGPSLLTPAPSKDLNQDNWRVNAHPNITPIQATSREGDLYEQELREQVLHQQLPQQQQQQQQQQPPKEDKKDEEGLDDNLEDHDVLAFEYASTIPPLPEPAPHRRIDQSRLREIRKKLDGHPTPKDIESAFNELLEDCVELSYDYIGNTVVQKLMEKGTDPQKLKMIERISPNIASIGIHKNGTWAIQKMIDTAKTPAQMTAICQYMKLYTPPLMLDQFGNYVVQCCLRLGTQRNQFIFDAMHARCWEIAQGRFGARAMRTCLESQYTTKRQQKHVAMSIVRNAVALCTNPNGSILITWLLDSSSLPGRFRVLAPQLVPHLAPLCTHKMASLTVLKVVNQNIEPDARDIIVKALFFSGDQPLEEVLGDQVHGVGLVHKILASPCVADHEKPRIAERVKFILGKLQVSQVQGYRRLMEELSVILMGPPTVVTSSELNKPAPIGQTVAQTNENSLMPGMGFGASGGFPSLVSPLDASFPSNVLTPPAPPPPVTTSPNTLPTFPSLQQQPQQQAQIPSITGMQPGSPVTGAIQGSLPSPSSPSFGFPNMYNPMFNPQFALMSMMMNPQLMQANSYMMQNPAFAQMLQQQMQQMQQMMQTGAFPAMPMVPPVPTADHNAQPPPPPPPPATEEDK